jgi:hypothetical protein
MLARLVLVMCLNIKSPTAAYAAFCGLRFKGAENSARCFSAANGKQKKSLDETKGTMCILFVTTCPGDNTTHDITRRDA